MKDRRITTRAWKISILVQGVLLLLLAVGALVFLFTRDASFLERLLGTLALLGFCFSSLSLNYCLYLRRTRQKERELVSRLKSAQRRYRAAMACTRDILFEYHRHSDRMFFYEPGPSLSAPPLVSEVAHYQRQLADTRQPGGGMVHPDDVALALAICAGKVAGKQEIRLSLPATRGQDYFWYHLYAARDETEKESPVIFGVFHNIHDQKTRTELLRKKSEQDPLTHLYNKQALHHNIGEYLAGDAAACGALLMIDLDNFKQVNDQYGHQCGDRVLADFARELQRIFHSGDLLGRIGGDEFLILMKETPAPAIVQEKAARILTCLGSVRYGRPLTCSIGIALFPSDGREFDLLFSRADQAMYAAKRQGKNAFCFYHTLPDDKLFPQQNTLANQNRTGAPYPPSPIDHPDQSLAPGQNAGSPGGSKQRPISSGPSRS